MPVLKSDSSLSLLSEQNKQNQREKKLQTKQESGEDDSYTGYKMFLFCILLHLPYPAEDFSSLSSGISLLSVNSILGFRNEI